MLHKYFILYHDSSKTSIIKTLAFTKFKCKNGAMVMINDANVLMIEVFEES